MSVQLGLGKTSRGEKNGPWCKKGIKSDIKKLRHEVNKLERKKTKKIKDKEVKEIEKFERKTRS